MTARSTHNWLERLSKARAGNAFAKLWTPMTNPYRVLPSIDWLLAQPEVRAIDGLPQALVVELAREIVTRAREAIRSGGRPADLHDLTAQVATAARDLRRPSLQRV